MISLLYWLTCPIIAVPVPSGMFTVRLNKAFLAPMPISTNVFGPKKSFDRNERKPRKRIVLHANSNDYKWNETFYESKAVTKDW